MLSAVNARAVTSGWLWRFLPDRLKRLYQHRLVGWLKGLPSDKQWRWSSILSTLKWGLSFGLVYLLVSQTGHKWTVNTAVSLALDGVLYLANRYLWREQEASDCNSASATVVLTAFFFAFNLGLMWLLLEQADLRVTTAKIVAVPIGLAMNPVGFWINSEIAFRKDGLRRLLRAVRIV